MDRMENRHWLAIGVIGLFSFSFWWVNKSWKTTPVKNTEAISYEMPRPKAAMSEYDISGRKIIHHYIEEKGQQTEGAPPRLANQPPALDNKGKLAAGKTPADPKKKENKKAVAKTKKKNQMAVEAISKESELTETATDPLAETSAPPSAPVVQAPPQEPVEKKAGPSPLVTKEDAMKTADQWREILFRDPTQMKNAVEFQRAYKSGEITADEFYRITGDLLTDAGEDHQKMALSIFKLETSVKTFSFLVSHYTEETPEGVRTQVYAILKTYGDLPQFSILSQLMSSRSSRVVAMAVQVLKSTVTAQEQILQGQGDSRGRSPGAAAIPSKNFEIFRQALNRLAQSGDTAA